MSEGILESLFGDDVNPGMITDPTTQPPLIALGIGASKLGAGGG